jgi:hypothetical protein
MYVKSGGRGASLFLIAWLRCCVQLEQWVGLEKKFLLVDCVRLR